MNKKRNIKTLINRPTSGNELLQLIGGQSNLLTYKDLCSCDDLLSTLKDGACIVLYEIEIGKGHWCCYFITLDDNGDETLEFFDPYAMIIDDELDYVKNKNKGHLKHLLKMIDALNSITTPLS